jgi:hypothetical protein
MKFERAWKVTGKTGEEGTEEWKEIDAERASMDLANAHGDKAVDKLKAEKTLSTRFAEYRVIE